MENPFESGHIKNYILLYASIVVIMILFFIASSMFHDVEVIEKKIFNTEINTTQMKENLVEEKNTTTKFKLIEVNY